jgi:hypothetical protein
MTRCVRSPCVRQAAVRIEQRYRDGSAVALLLCRACARRWLRERPKTARVIS